MAQTFDIRFARSAGLAALLEAPTNRFRWTGSGSLSIDSHGISVAVKRGLLSLLARNRMRRISATDLEQVFREGEALRVDFVSGARARDSLLFWARDPDTAARIVRLLPTTRTVELEHSTDPRQKRFPSSAKTWAGVAVAALVCAAVGWQLKGKSETRDADPFVQLPIYEVPPLNVPVVPGTSGDPSRTDAPLENDSVDPFTMQVPIPPLRMPVLPADEIIPIPRDSVGYPLARHQLALFESEVANLWSDYRDERDLLASGSLPADQFADHLEALEFRWWNVTFRILDNRDLDARELLDLRASLLGTARHWRGFLNGYAAGIRSGDHVRIAKSFDELAIAEEQQARARRYVR